MRFTSFKYEPKCLRIGPGEFVSIIGPNGAGKTTLVNVLTGLLKPTSGTIRFKGKDIAGVGPVRLSGVGMARSFQLVNIFPQLTVRETIAVAVTSRLNLGNRVFASLGGNRAVRENVDEIAALFGLVPKLGSLAMPSSKSRFVSAALCFKLFPGCYGSCAGATDQASRTRTAEPAQS